MAGLVKIHVAVQNEVIAAGAPGFADFYEMAVQPEDTAATVIDAARCGAAGCFSLKLVYTGRGASKTNIKDFSSKKKWTEAVNMPALATTEVIGASEDERCYIMMPRDSQQALAARPDSR